MPYPDYIIGVARKLRRNSTRAEELQWKHLRNRQLGGVKVVRQHSFNRYIVDCYCAKLKLVVEIEGGVHQLPRQKEYDRNRFEELKLRRLRVLRFSNEEVLHHTSHVLEKIIQLQTDHSLGSPDGPMSQ